VRPATTISAVPSRSPCRWGQLSFGEVKSKIFTRLRPVGDWKILYRSLLKPIRQYANEDRLTERSSKSAPKGMMTSRSQEATLGTDWPRLRRTSTFYSPISEDWSYSCNCHRCLTSCLGIAPRQPVFSPRCGSGPDWRVARSCSGSRSTCASRTTQLEDDVGERITEHSKLSSNNWRLRPKIDSSARHGFDRVEHELRLANGGRDTHDEF
jgi:hypothetical protein